MENENMTNETLEADPLLSASLPGESLALPSTASVEGASPEELENKLIEQTLANGGTKSPQDLYAQLFYLYIPKFKNEVKHMSNKQLRRLLMALIETPLNDKPYKMMEVGERMVFQMASNLLEAKFGMLMAVMAEEQRKKQEALPEETSASVDVVEQQVSLETQG